jgi:hypothetical protein
MKKITLLILLLTSTTIATAQQLYVEAGKTMSSFDYKNSQGNSLDNLQEGKENILELKTPLNILQCKNCILENPAFDFKQINEDAALINDYKKIVDEHSLVIDVLFDASGHIVESKPNLTLGSAFFKSYSKKIVQNLLDRFVGKKIFTISSNSNTYYKSTISFLIVDNKLQLNQILH